MNKIEIDSEIFSLRTLLNAVSDASYAYKTLAKRYPLNDLRESEESMLIDAYRGIIDQLQLSLQNYKE